MKRRWVGVLAAFLLATLGTLVLVSYVQAARNEAVADEQLVRVLVVTAEVERGTAAADLEGEVEAVDVPARLRVEGAVSDLVELGDLHVTADLVPGEQLTRARFATQGDAARGEAPEGLLQVTVALDPERALGGKVRAGDSVAVLLSFDPFETDEGKKTANTTHLELHKVTVTDVQLQAQGGAAPAGDPVDEGVANAAQGKYLVTLAIDAPAVEQVVFAAEHGFVWLSTEPADANEGGTKIVTRGNVYTAGLQ
jgi:pilus assembly protein CpaB